MEISKEAQKIVDNLYKAYGTDTGILFGVTSKMVVSTIVQLTIEQNKNIVIAFGKYIAGYRPGDDCWTSLDQEAYDFATGEK